MALPLTALALLLLFNAVFVEDFFSIQMMETATFTVVRLTFCIEQVPLSFCLWV